MEENMKKVLILIGVFIFLALNTNVASACTCATIGTPTSNLAQVQAVFLGKVVEAKPHEWTLAVNKVWKGNLKE
jgi:hypothetical protein